MKNEENESSLTLFLGVGVALGTSFGVTMGAVFENVGLGVALGPSIGVSLAFLLWVLFRKDDDPTDV
ncbi:MAG: hypothetical protein JJ921_12640 [Pseudomonadales bacterium]|nr:hypothetical protein [Pseudomonadales bacterium]MBO7006180.1 hypothetical protein [Pseudomonadales bacterium]